MTTLPRVYVYNFSHITPDRYHLCVEVVSVTLNLFPSMSNSVGLVTLCGNATTATL